MAGALVDISLRKRQSGAPDRTVMELDGATLERVDFDGQASVDFSWSASRHYLAVHDIRLLDGETALDARPRVSPRDLRDKLTFAPEGCPVSGWSTFAPRACSYTALAFDVGLVKRETERGDPISGAAPLLYFSHPALLATLGKIHDQLASPTDRLYLETLTLTAAIEADRLATGGGVPQNTGGRLSAQQSRLVLDYLEEKLHEDIALEDLAKLVSLSRFHFSRTFKNTFGEPLRTYVLSHRIERAKSLLAATSLPIARIGEAVGFHTQARFAAAFREVTGSTPTEYRRQAM